jgi:hypothetical protein
MYHHAERSIDVKAVSTMCSILVALVGFACSQESPADHREPRNQRRAPEAATSALDAAETPTHATDSVQRAGLSPGQRLYVPVYSHVYWGPKPRALNLACTLSIRNIDPETAISLETVDYYDTRGSLVGHYVDDAVTLAPLETTEYYLEERDVTGGSGANFIVDWTADTPVSPPVVEAVMIGIHSGQGISFVSESREIVPRSSAARHGE